MLEGRPRPGIPGVANGNNTVVAFSSSQILSSGSPTPVVAFTTTSLMNAPTGGIAFDPAQIPLQFGVF
jgi:hypothetical protein